MIIDMHTHLGYSKVFDAWPEERLLALMDEAGIDQAVVLALESPESLDDLLTSREVLDACARHFDRLIPFCAVDPRMGDPAPDKERRLRERLARYIDLGCKGFGEHKPGLPVDDPRSRMLYALCGELRLPVLLHLDDFHNRGEEAFARMLAAYPRVTWIAHSALPWADLDRLARWFDVYPNLVVETSPWMGTGGTALKRDRDAARRLLGKYPDRVLFGTDAGVAGADREFFDPVVYMKFIRDLDLADEVYRAVMGRSAARWLGL